TMIGHIAKFFSKSEKLFIANTNTTVDNLRSKVSAENRTYSTAKSFISGSEKNKKWDLLFIDECSTLSNESMEKIMEVANFDLLILVGDVHQIKSIRFGNWFNIVKEFIPQNSVLEMKTPFRNTNNDLLCIWDRVRKYDNSFLEPLVKGDYTKKLNEKVFKTEDIDEIILCLNYDGFYGINNVNKLLQNYNTNPGYNWGIHTYKVGDPILFDESNRFAPLIY